MYCLLLSGFLVQHPYKILTYTDNKNIFAGCDRLDREIPEWAVDSRYSSSRHRQPSEGFVEWSQSSDGPAAPTTTELPVDPRHNGLLKDIGSINVGFNVGVAVPGNDPVSVGTSIGVGFGGSGLAGGLPIGQNIFPRQGEQYSLNDYDGDKYQIIPGKAGKYIQAVREGRLKLIHYKPEKSLIGINGGIGVGK